MTARSTFRRARLVETVTHGPLTAPRWVHHLARVVIGFALAWAQITLAGFPWFGAWILGALFVIAFRFVAVDWCRWRPIRARYIDAPRARLTDEHTACALALSLAGGLLVPWWILGDHRSVAMGTVWALATVALALVYIRTCPLSEP